MEVKMVYIAFDGEEFESEAACLYHEEQHKLPMDGLVLFDEDKLPMVIDPSKSPLEELERIEGYYYYIAILEPAAAKKFLLAADDYLGTDSDDILNDVNLAAGDIFAWDDDREHWICINRRIIDDTAICDELRSAGRVQDIMNDL